MEIKNICLNVIAYILTAVLLFYSAWYEFKHGNKTVSVLTFIMGLFVVWNAWENYKQMQKQPVTDFNNRNLLPSATFI